MIIPSFIWGCLKWRWLPFWCMVYLTFQTESSMQLAISDISRNSWYLPFLRIQWSCVGYPLCLPVNLLCQITCWQIVFIVLISVSIQKGGHWNGNGRILSQMRRNRHTEERKTRKFTTGIGFVVLVHYSRSHLHTTTILSTQDHHLSVVQTSWLHDSLPASSCSRSLEKSIECVTCHLSFISDSAVWQVWTAVSRCLKL